MALNETGFYGGSSGWADIEKFIQDQETTRQINEQARIQNEIARESVEAERDESEASRESAENSRLAAEAARVQAESARTDRFESNMAGWQGGVDSLLATGGTYEARISALEAIVLHANL